MSDQSDRHLDMEQLAELLGMSREWVRKQIQRRQLPHRRYGRAVRFAPEDVEAIIAAAGESPLPAPRAGATKPNTPPPSPPPPQPPRPGHPPTRHLRRVA